MTIHEPIAEDVIQYEKPKLLQHIQPFVFDPDKEYPEEPAIFEGLMSRRDLVLWLGREKHRKSNVLLQLAICAATGRDFLTFRFMGDRPLRVTYLDYESKGRQFKNRYAAICDDLGLTPEERLVLKHNLKVIHVTEALRKGIILPAFPVKGDEAITGWWSDFESDFHADLFIIDPMRLFHREEENSSAIEGLFQKVRAWSKEASVIFAHHLSKRESKELAFTKMKGYQPFDGNARIWSDYGRGSTAIKAHSDVIICQEQAMIRENEIVSLAGFGKDQEDFGPLTLKETGHNTFTWRVKGSAGEAAKALEILRAHGGPFKNKGEAVAVLMRGTDVSQASAYRRINDLERNGLIRWKSGQLVV